MALPEMHRQHPNTATRAFPMYTQGTEVEVRKKIQEDGRTTESPWKN